MSSISNIKHGLEIPTTSKRYGNLYELCFTKDNLYSAYLDARKGKRGKQGTYLFEINLGENLETLYKELKYGEYKISPYKKFVIYEPKKRIIKAPHFRDLIVQHAIYRVIYNIFNPTFIDTSFACRKDGGTHKASYYTTLNLRKYDDELYTVKLDIRKFFYSIDRDILKGLFEEKIKDKRFVNLMIRFANDDTPVGIPIGNLLSQLYSLIYLNELDHFVKRVLKIESYVRYVDDFVAIGLTLEEAKKFKSNCETFVKDKLNLELSHWHIQKVKRGLNFVGYKTFKNFKVVRKHSLYKFKKAVIKQNIEAVVSIIGHSKNTKNLKYLKSILEINMKDYENKLPQGTIKCLNM